MEHTDNLHIINDVKSAARTLFHFREKDDRIEEHVKKGNGGNAHKIKTVAITY
jgi:hypothetical protein